MSRTRSDVSHVSLSQTQHPYTKDDFISGRPPFGSIADLQIYNVSRTHNRKKRIWVYSSKAITKFLRVSLLIPSHIKLSVFIYFYFSVCTHCFLFCKNTTFSFAWNKFLFFTYFHKVLYSHRCPRVRN